MAKAHREVGVAGRAASRGAGAEGLLYRAVVFAVVLCLLLAMLFLHARAYLPFLSDDALISLRYAQRLAEGKGLTWNDGERVEGYTNFLWTVACAGLRTLGRI